MKRAGLTLLLALTLALSAAASAGAATVNIGQVAPPATPGSCGGCTGFQVATDPASTAPGYAVPAGNWTVTYWSVQAGPTTDGHARLRIFRPAGVNLYRLVAESAEESVPFGAERSFTTSIPVQAGDLLGLRTGNSAGDIAPNFSTAAAGDVNWQVAGDPAINQTVGTGGDFATFFVNTSKRTNIAATLFHADPAPPDTMPPDTTIIGGPGKKLAKGKAKFEFSSSEANSRFMCKLDRKPFQPCSSPKKYKVDPGKHKFQVEAADPSSNVDPTPAKKKFTVPD